MSISAQILIVEDDLILNQQLMELISGAGHKTKACFDGDSCLIEAASEQYDLILLDLMLPKRDGLTVLDMLRKSMQTPVIILTAKGAEEERIKGLKQGADDYILKPFNPTELLLRIEALLRRSRSSFETAGSIINIDGLELDLNTQKILYNEQNIELTSIQFNLLWLLALHKGEVLSKAYLYQQVLNRSLGAYDRSLDMHLSRVRRKLKDAQWNGDRIRTVHGKGYCLV